MLWWVQPNWAVYAVLFCICSSHLTQWFSVCLCSATCRVIREPGVWARIHQHPWSKGQRNVVVGLLRNGPRTSSPSGPTLLLSFQVFSSCRRRSPLSYLRLLLTGSPPLPFMSPCASWCCTALRRSLQLGRSSDGLPIWIGTLLWLWRFLWSWSISVVGCSSSAHSLNCPCSSSTVACRRPTGRRAGSTGTPTTPGTTLLWPKQALRMGGFLKGWGTWRWERAWILVACQLTPYTFVPWVVPK